MIKTHRIKSIDLILFLRQFNTLITSGISILKSCDILEKSQAQKNMRLLLYAIKRDLLSGKSLYDCFEQHPQYFDPFTCHLIRLGEHTGKLDTILTIIADYHEKNYFFKKRTQQALFYPCIVAASAFLITLCLFIFVVPKFADLFSDFHTPLPLLTTCVFYLSKQLQKNSLWLIGLSVFTSISLFYLQQIPRFRHYLYQFTIQLPIIHTYHTKRSLSRFARHLALTHLAGVPITEGLTLTAYTCGAQTFSLRIQQLRQALCSGFSLHKAMESAHTFPILMIQMIKVGEESGTLDAMLNKIADFLEADCEQLIHRLHELIEPLLMIGLGVLIGGIVIGMYLPLFRLGNTL